MGRTKGQLTNMESWAILNGKEGHSFYSEKPDKHLTAIATHHGRKIVTERQLVVTTAKSKPIAQYITKVTLK